MTASSDLASPVLVDVYAAAAHVRLTYGIELPAATIRQWARRRRITHHGHRGRRTLVDLIQVDRRAELLATQHTTTVPAPRRPT